MISSHLRTDAWLLWGLRSLPGVLLLSHGRLSFSAVGAGNLRTRQLLSLEREIRRPGLAMQLAEGESALLFDVPRSEVHDVCFPWYYFSGGLKLSIHGNRYRFGFDPPVNTRGSAEGADLLGVISRARRRGNAWKAALIERTRP